MVYCEDYALTEAHYHPSYDGGSLYLLFPRGRKPNLKQRNRPMRLTAI